MCQYISPIDTEVEFIILMHPKEFKKVKNGSGRLTHLSLTNSKLFIGIDFTNHKEINHTIKSRSSFVLYPDENSINLSTTTLAKGENITIFIIDATWSCSLQILRDSHNLKVLEKISFNSTKLSEFKIKEQPNEFCLSTIESTLTILELLTKSGIESLKKSELNNFLTPFHKMVSYQLESIKSSPSSSVRFKQYS